MQNTKLYEDKRRDVGGGGGGHIFTDQAVQRKSCRLCQLHAKRLVRWKICSCEKSILSSSI